jgi:NAD(P)-dependent dehydrogenase (short-subunit alcohol dehydrogenase family)
MGRLKTKVALVTGGANGIGFGICEAFVREGAHVILADITKTGDNHKSKMNFQFGGSISFQHLDVTDERQWMKAISYVRKIFGHLDILVNNAGIASRLGLQEASIEDWMTTLDVNAKGVYLGIKYAVQLMKKTGGGSIVNIASISALIGGGGSVDYRSSKGAVRLLTKSMALILASHNIRVNGVFPGDIITSLNEEYLKDPNVLNERISLVPLGRLGTTEDVANLAIFLASDEASYITGAEIIIDGGRTAY